MGADVNDADEEDELVAVSLTVMAWADVCAAFQGYIREGARGAPASQRDALFALGEIDRVMRGAAEHAPPDELLGPS